MPVDTVKNSRTPDNIGTYSSTLKSRDEEVHRLRWCKSKSAKSLRVSLRPSIKASKESGDQEGDKRDYNRGTTGAGIADPVAIDAIAYMVLSTPSSFSLRQEMSISARLMITLGSKSVIHRKESGVNIHVVVETMCRRHGEFGALLQGGCSHRHGKGGFLAAPLVKKLLEYRREEGASNGCNARSRSIC
ncbi:hypothetical protein K438DRAFT_1785621 [Mycena galopus ATCC 62051]|nr:hypothetical protein K438DRAFT_1785621 [Mycena galopus ATCC 62051]